MRLCSADQNSPWDQQTWRHTQQQKAASPLQHTIVSESLIVCGQGLVTSQDSQGTVREGSYWDAKTTRSVVVSAFLRGLALGEADAANLILHQLTITLRRDRPTAAHYSPGHLQLYDYSKSTPCVLSTDREGHAFKCEIPSGTVPNLAHHTRTAFRVRIWNAAQHYRFVIRCVALNRPPVVRLCAPPVRSERSQTEGWEFPAYWYPYTEQITR